MRKLSKRELTLFVIFWAILLAVIGIEFVVTPSLNKIKVLKSERADLQLTWDELQYYKGTEDLLNRQVEELKQQNFALNQQLPSAQSSHVYWEFINKSAEKSGVTIVQIQEDDLDDKKNNRLIHLSFTGDFSETVTFIEAIQSMPFAHAISEGALQGGEKLITTTLSMYISAYDEINGEQLHKMPGEQKVLSNRNPFE